MRYFWMLQILVVLLLPASVYAWVHRGDRERALRGAAALIAAMYVGLFGMFAIGSVFDEPGGWMAVWLSAVWLVPLLALTALAWYRPDSGIVVLAVVMLAIVVVFASSMVAPEAWNDYEDSHGPIRALITFALAAPLAVLGWRRPRPAGWLLILLPLLPLSVLAVNAAGGFGMAGWIVAIVTSPAAIVGALYLLATQRPRSRAPRPRHRVRPHTP